jgi:hypothetical protein
VTSVSVSTTGRRRQRSLVDRLLAVFPALVIALAIFVFYAVEAWTRKTPWIFTDELEWTQISRSIASTGHAARRGDPIYFKSLYAYLIAPAWWIHSTSAAYSAVKYVNAIVMPLAAIPTYLLARMLVTRRAAVAVAVGSVAVPAMAYVTSIVTDVLAYPYFALCSWLSIRALRAGRRRDVILAVVFLLGGYFIRQRQFTTLPLAFVIAAFGLWFTGPRGKWVRRNWSRGDKLGALALAIGAAMLFNRYVLQHVSEWQVPTQYYKNRLVDYGLKAGLSFTIGLGVLPVIGGLVSLRLPERRGDPVYRAYAAWTAASIGVISVYAAVKATSLSLNFATLWEERDLIYLAPLLLLGTAMVFQAKRLDWRFVAGATVLVLVMVGLKGLQLQFPYYEAPGSSIPAALANYRHWTDHSVRIGLFGIFALSLGLIALRRRRWAAPLAAALLLGWMLAGEISMTVGLDNGADQYRANLPAQLNWVDAQVHGQPVTYVGQAVLDPFGEQLTEFWNRSIKHVTSLDGTAPGPGPTSTPNLVNPNGLLSDDSGDPYVLADSGVALAARPVARRGSMTLYHTGRRPWHLLYAVQQVDSDTWCPNWCTYTYFKPNQTGTLVITIGREGYSGSAPAGRATIRVGTVRIDAHSSAQLKHVYVKLHHLVENGKTSTIAIPVPRTPVRVEISIPNTIPPSAADRRNLGAQVGFGFKPTGSR